MQQRRSAAIILAGGASKRFKVGEERRDKALVQLDGKPMVAHVVERALEAVELAVVVTRTKEREVAYASAISEALGGLDRVVICSDLPNLPESPLTGITTAFEALEAAGMLPEVAVVLPVDVPFVKPALIATIADRARKAGAAVPTWPTGAIEPLIQGLDARSARGVVRVLSSLGRTRPDDLVRGARNVAFLSVDKELRALDPRLESFVNINTPEDLETKEPRVPSGGEVLTDTVVASFNEYQPRPELGSAGADELRLELGKVAPSSHFWRGVLAWRIGELSGDRDAFAEAARSFEEEGQRFAIFGLRSLAAHAYTDAARCWVKALNFDRAKEDESKASELFEAAGVRPPKAQR